MNVPHMPSDDFQRIGAQLLKLISDYHRALQAGEIVVRPDVQPGDVAAMLPDAPPPHGEPWDAIVEDIQRIVIPGVMHWQSPDFFGYFPANASYPAMLADLLCAGLGVQGMLWQTGPACTEMETRVLDWLADMIGLPPAFRSNAKHEEGGGGVIHGTASEAVLTALVAARHRAVTNGAASSDALVAYTSTQAHSSVMKAARIIGLPEQRVRLIDTDAALAMSPSALRAAMGADAASDRSPFFVCATLGTTSTGAIDPLAPIGEIAHTHHAWVHCDAAWAGSALICPEHRGMLDGVEGCDSFNFNPHKWMLTNFDCSAMWVSDRQALLSALSITPEYLRNRASDAGAVIDYRDWHIPLGRRFRALKLWFVLRHYGVEGLQAHIREGVRLAEIFESLVAEDDRFEMPVERSLSLVCFCLKRGDADTRALLDRVNNSGACFLTHTIIPAPASGGTEPRFVIRMAIGGAHTREQHVRAAWDVIAREAAGI
ncbi:MAG: pyridoxal-dependent decarboxylase [Planctomycetota bacterium]